MNRDKHAVIPGLAILLAAVIAAGCGEDQGDSVVPPPPAVTATGTDGPGAVPGPDAAPGPAPKEESRLSREAKEWTEQTRELGAAAIDSGKSVMQDVSEKSGTAWQDVKAGSAEFYEAAKEKTKDVYDAAKTKGGEVLDYAREDFQQKKQEAENCEDCGPAAAE